MRRRAVPMRGVPMRGGGLPKRVLPVPSKRDCKAIFRAFYTNRKKIQCYLQIYTNSVDFTICNTERRKMQLELTLAVAVSIASLVFTIFTNSKKNDKELFVKLGVITEKLENLQ
jgi:hypothetical protein